MCETFAPYRGPIFIFLFFLIKILLNFIPIWLLFILLIRSVWCQTEFRCVLCTNTNKASYLLPGSQVDIFSVFHQMSLPTPPAVGCTNVERQKTHQTRHIPEPRCALTLPCFDTWQNVYSDLSGFLGSVPPSGKRGEVLRGHRSSRRGLDIVQLLSDATFTETVYTSRRKWANKY